MRRAANPSIPRPPNEVWCNQQVTESLDLVRLFSSCVQDFLRWYAGQPPPEQASWSLGIEAERGVPDGCTLSHTHVEQVFYVTQTLAFWMEGFRSLPL